MRVRCSIQTAGKVAGCLVRDRARQNFDGEVGSSTGNFNDAMVRDRQFTAMISVWMEH
ncbi:hypothetical protein AALB64_05245 [Lachnospiraceae bacterium 45-P1]